MSLTDVVMQLLAMKRVGILQGGHPHALDEVFIPPAQKLRIAEYNELISSIPTDQEDILLKGEVSRRRNPTNLGD